MNKDTGKAMKKQILSFLLFASILILALEISTAFAQAGEGGPFYIPDSGKYGTLIGAPKLNGETAIQQLSTLIGGYRGGEGGLIGVARPIIGAISVLFIIISALRILFSDGEEGTIDKAKNGIIYGLMGLALISIAGEIMKVLSLSDEAIKAAYQDDGLVCYKTILSDPSALQCRAKLFSRTVQILMTFVKYLLGSLAVLEIITSAFRMATMGGESESLAMDKKKLIWGSVGFLLVIFSDTAISKVFYKLNFNTVIGVDGIKPKLDPAQGVAEIIGFTNFIVSIVGPLAILSLIVGGIMYMMNNGDESKMQEAKRIITFSLIGIIVIYGAFGLVSTIISGQFG